ncbi:MAG: cob(I)yrinic acid a,c-diamide adenosyltransferase [Nitrospirae bacterium]|nr:cob(I)yrinic acid a,c-diamide adenosyltransferase [Nitrospirota bacterium]
MKKGLIHIYTGDGKGKTTAAMGLAMRAAGRGKKVLILQFLKGGLRGTGEAAAAEKLKIKFVRFAGQISPIFNPKVRPSKLKKSVREAIAFSLKEIKTDSYDLVIMDEFNNLLHSGYATMNDAKKLIKEKPARLELVFTGRGAPEELIAIGDYVTEMKLIKHPYTKGVKARRGIEY